MMRSFELAKQLVAEGALVSIQEKNISERDILEAAEVMMIGTTLDVLPVVEYEGQLIGDGKQGVVAKQLLKVLRQDMKQGSKVTPVYAPEKVEVY